MPLADTTAARSRILGALRQASRPALPPPSLTPYLDGPYARGSLGNRVDPGSLVAQFKAAAQGWRAEVIETTPSRWQDAVVQVLRARACRRVAVGTGGRFPGGALAEPAGIEWVRFDRPLEAWKAELFDDIDAAITGAEAGIADTGSLLLIPGPHEPRTLSLVPPLHMAVLTSGRLYASLAAARSALAPERAMPTNLLLITGPSKTADIQQTLAYGAHGPKELVIVLVDDGPEGAGGAA